MVAWDHSRKVCQFNFSTNFDEGLFSKTGRNFFHFNSSWNFCFCCATKRQSSALEMNFIGKPLQWFRKASCSRCHRFMFPDSAEQRLNIFQFYLHSITRTVRTVDWSRFVWQDMEWAREVLHCISEWQQCNVALPPSNLLGVRHNITTDRCPRFVCPFGLRNNRFPAFMLPCIT